MNRRLLGKGKKRYILENNDCDIFVTMPFYVEGYTFSSYTNIIGVVNLKGEQDHEKYYSHLRGCPRGGRVCRRHQPDSLS